MCSLIGSFSKEKIVELVKLNLYRGQHSYSYSYYNPEDNSIQVTRGLGEIPLDDIKIPEGHYCIAHMQAPTTENKDINSVHPAQIGNSYLWHNGIIKASWIEKRKNHIEVSEIPSRYNTWDTYLILRQYVEDGHLNNIDGTFSCVYYSPMEGLQLFRNEISPLFLDDQHNISSTKFYKSHSLPANKVWTFMPGENILEDGDFNTVENPYYFDYGIEQ
jgi:glutamine phosphoribosylpyrophosphate amidotransferase